MLFEVEEMPDISIALWAHWQLRPVLIDATHIIDEYGRNQLAAWLPSMFKRARSNQVKAIPVALLTDLGETEAAAFRDVIAADERIKFAICIQSGEWVEPEFYTTMSEALNRLGLTPGDCAVLVDFGGSEFGDPAIVAPIISGALETLQDFGSWQQIIFQGTHYPETNPAEDGSVKIWPRNEWLAWQQAVKFDPTTAEHLTFGDYAADNAKMTFGDSRAPAIRHLRYTTPDTWRIQRAVKSGPDAMRMYGVCKAIVDSGEFAGSGFSEADAYIARAVKELGAKPGNATTWRQLNTTHHITQVVADIAKVRGITIKRIAANELDTQLSLLDRF